LYCFVERDKGGFNMLSPVYKLFIEANTSGGPARFAMSAKKKVSNRTSYYLVSLVIISFMKYLSYRVVLLLMSLNARKDAVPSTDDRGSATILGKIRANHVGSHYLFTDHGLAPDKATTPSTLRKELGFVKVSNESL